ncbi:hypothetical protein QCM77_40880 [Bradyrhizobium sp. SSUT18]|uniref:hypothetical protein n=1 Tax=unclassified Bradyrhizobium TaxID=2631580 RepID=UPI00244D4AB0|nr:MULTISPECIES: hypothetical protein [unclassified Bradyrhizobium]MDH2350029.1 hypothetical protein [Bradyrhizobium sp. SSUT112]MDH2406186.1 hypothetical protein [Bradyrhizobium sp. SSUT18]
MWRGLLSRKCFHIVMAGLVPAIHDLSRGTKNVDARDKPGHDESDGRFIPMESNPRLLCMGLFSRYSRQEPRVAMPDSYGVPQPGDAEDYQQFMLALYDLMEVARDIHACPDGIEMLKKARLLLLDDFETKHPAYGSGRAVWR